MSARGRAWRPVVGAAIVFCAPLPGGAQQPRPAVRTPYRALRFDEDYRYLRGYLRGPRDAAPFAPDPWDRLKYVPLPGPPGSYLSLGGEVRAQYERSPRPGFGRGTPDPNGYALGRALLHADLHAGTRARLFAQVAGAAERGRAGGPRATDVDDADLQQAFADVDALRGSAASGLRLRVGRQEMTYGSGRLFSVRDPSNVRRSFDAVRVTGRTPRLTADGFVARQVGVRPGAWDDRSSAGDEVAGVYLTVPVGRVLGGGVDLYGLRRALARATYARGTAPERRSTVGARVWGRRGAWDHNTEVLVQRGRFGATPIRAAVVAGDVGRTWAHAPARPRVGLRAAVSTGDADSVAGALGAVNPLFPRGFVVGAPLGPVNLTNVHPTLDLQLTPRLAAFAEVDAFWRTRRADGVYDAGGALVTAARASPRRAVGRQAYAQLDWQATRHLRANAGVARFAPGPALRAALGAPATTYAVASVTYTF